MPVRVSLINDDDLGIWVIIDWMIDCCFMMDIIITFFSAYFDSDDNLIFQRKRIIVNYLTGWFLLDLLSIFPFYKLNGDDNDNTRINNLVRVARLPRLYKLIKIVKLVRMLKVIKDRDKFKHYMNGVLKLSPAYERLFVAIIGIFLFCHVSSCVWFILVGLVDDDENWIDNNYLTYASGFDQYIACFYLVVQTVVTVGYGDMSPKVPQERAMACVLMIVGVFFYSIIIGFVSSLINDVEIANQKYNHKLNVLARLKKDYMLPVFFTKKLKSAIKYENKQTIESKHFISDLPTQLAVELSCIMHQHITDSIAFLQNRPKTFIACLTPLLKPITVAKKEVIFTEGDPADEIFFIKSGIIGYVLPKFKNECYLKVREGYFFGEIDLLFYGEIRKYTAIALKETELYVLSKKDFKHVFLMEHREIGTSMYNNAYKRKTRMRKAYKEACAICKKHELSEHKDKPHKLRLTYKKKERFDPDQDNSFDDSDSSDDAEALLDIVEEEEEFEDDINKQKEVASVTAEFGAPAKKPMLGMMISKAALAFKKKIPAGSALVKKPGGSIGLDGTKDDSNFGELSKKMDGLASKLKRLETLGKTMRSQSSKDLNGLASPAHHEDLYKSGLQSKFGTLTPSARLINLSPVGSPSNSELSDKSNNPFKSPNVLRRALISKGEKEKDSPNPVARIQEIMANRKNEGETSEESQMNLFDPEGSKLTIFRQVSKKSLFVDAPTISSVDSKNEESVNDGKDFHDYYIKGASIKTIDEEDEKTGQKSSAMLVSKDVMKVYKSGEDVSFRMETQGVVTGNSNLDVSQSNDKKVLAEKKSNVSIQEL